MGSKKKVSFQVDEAVQIDHFGTDKENHGLDKHLKSELEHLENAKIKSKCNRDYELANFRKRISIAAMIKKLLKSDLVKTSAFSMEEKIRRHDLRDEFESPSTGRTVSAPVQTVSKVDRLRQRRATVSWATDEHTKLLSAIGKKIRERESPDNYGRKSTKAPRSRSSGIIAAFDDDLNSFIRLNYERHAKHSPVGDRSRVFFLSFPLISSHSRFPFIQIHILSSHKIL